MTTIKRYVFQEDEDWKDYRETVFTASEINRLTAEPSKKAKEAGQELSDGAITYIIEKISARFGNPKFVYKNLEMEHGKDTEPSAALKFCELLNLNPASDEVIYTSQGGTVFFSDGIVGGTPDIILPSLKAICEIKCPNPQTHLYNKCFLTELNFRQNYPVYYDQMQLNMYLSEADYGYFFSFDDRFKAENIQHLTLRIERDEQRINEILDKASKAHELMNHLINTKLS